MRLEDESVEKGRGEDKRVRKAKPTIRKPGPLRRARETPQIQHLTHGQVENPRRVLGDAQLGEGGGVGAGELALLDVRVGGGEVVVVVAGEPGVDGAGGDEGDVDRGGGCDADFEAARGAYGVGGVEDVSVWGEEGG